MSTLDARLAALLEYEIMDTPPEQAFDDLTRLTSFICGTPIATVTLLDQQRQWFKSAVGTTDREGPIEHAFCAHAIQQDGIFTVPDALQDARFVENPLVTGAPFIRFYAGVPLTTPQGVSIGTLCAIDRKPRELTMDQEEALSALGRQVMSMLELRRTVKALSIALTEKRKAEREVTALQELLPICAWCHKVRDDESFWHSVEDYLSARSDMRFSHGVCPDCAAKLRQEMGLKPK